MAEEASFSTAARHLFISQQSLSKQIARLEEELGTELFMRTRPLRLTQDGKLFLQTAKEMLQLKSQFDESCSRSKSGTKVVHVGIEHTIARSILPRVLPRYLRRHPDTFVRISEESPEALEKTVYREGVDMVIGSISAPPPAYKTVSLCRKEQLLVVPKSIMRLLCGNDYERRCAEFKSGADLRFFESAPFIKQPRDSSGGRSLMSYMKYYGVQPKFVCELTNVENAFQLACSGLGVMVYAKLFWDMLDAQLQRDYLEKIDVFPLPYLPDIDKVCAYFNGESEDSPTTSELLALFTDFFADYEHGILWDMGAEKRI